ncbi:MAG: hypothetical protein ACKPAJ_01155, partial [Actinomycetota bacterium]
MLEALFAAFEFVHAKFGLIFRIDPRVFDFHGIALWQATALICANGNAKKDQKESFKKEGIKKEARQEEESRQEEKEAGRQEEKESRQEKAGQEKAGQEKEACRQEASCKSRRRREHRSR